MLREHEVDLMKLFRVCGKYSRTTYGVSSLLCCEGFVIAMLCSVYLLESNTIGFENGIRWLTCVQGAPVPHGVTGAEMIERGKPETVWPARWKAPHKNKGKNHANPPSTRARVPAPPRSGRTARPSPNGDSKLNRAYEPDDYDTEQPLEPVHVHRAAPKATQEPVRAQAPKAVDGTRNITTQNHTISDHNSTYGRPQARR